MKKFAAVAVLTLAVCSAHGQVLPPPVAPKPAPTPRGGAERSRAPLATLLLHAEVSCTVEVDGKPTGALEAFVPRSVPVTLGERLVTAATADGRRFVEKVDVGSAGQKVVMIRFEAARPAGPPPVPDAVFDEALGRAWLAFEGFEAASRYRERVLAARNGFRDLTVNQALYNAMQAVLMAAKPLEAMTSADAGRTRIKDEVLRATAAVKQHTELMAKAITAAQKNKKWLGEGQDLRAQAEALEPATRLSPGVLDTLRESAAFRSAIPFERQLVLGLAADPRDFDLGATPLPSSPLTLLAIQPGGVAEQLGLKAGDRLLSGGGAPFQSLWDLKLYLREQSPGARAPLVFERGGKVQQREVKVPALPGPG